MMIGRLIMGYGCCTVEVGKLLKMIFVNDTFQVADSEDDFGRNDHLDSVRRRRLKLFVHKNEGLLERERQSLCCSS